MQFSSDATDRKVWKLRTASSWQQQLNGNDLETQRGIFYSLASWGNPRWYILPCEKIARQRNKQIDAIKFKNTNFQISNNRPVTLFMNWNYCTIVTFHYTHDTVLLLAGAGLYGLSTLERSDTQYASLKRFNFKTQEMHTKDAAFENNLLQYCTVSVRSTLQNFAKHNWMKIFTLTSSVFVKASLGSAIAGAMQNECRIQSFLCVSAPNCGKIALFATANRDHWKFLLRTERRHCPFKVFYASCYINNRIWVLIGCCWQYVLKIGSFMECCQSNIDHVSWCDCARKEYA